MGRLGDPRALPYLKLIPQDDIHQAFFGSVSAAMGQQAERLRGKLTARELSKVMLGLPLADSIMLATAEQYDATLWTQDSDFKGVEGVQYIEKL